MNIYIPIEVKARDLEGRALLALAAAERGHTVIFGAKADTRVMARKGELPPGIVHNKSLTPGESTLDMLDDFVTHGHLITSQDEESGLLDESYDYFARQRFSETTIGKTSRVFAWGDHDAASLRKLYQVYSDRITVTGSPRVDFWRDEFQPYFQQQAFEEVKKGRPYLLIASNFGTLLNENQIWNRFARMREAGYYNRDPEKEYHDYKYAAYHLNLIGEFVRMIRSMATTFPDYDILVRPHPVESVDAWKKLIGENNPNVKIHRTGSISGWIRNASLLIHNGCTSALEAAACGIPRIAYRPIPSEFEREIPNRTSFNIHSLDAMQDLITDLVEGRHISSGAEVEERKNEILQLRFANLNGPLAVDRMVDAWESDGEAGGLSEVPFTSAQPDKWNRRDAFNKKVKRPLARLKNSLFFKTVEQGSSDKLLRSDHKFPDLQDNEIAGLTSRLQSTLNRFHNVKYERVGKRSFRFFMGD